jgi:hydroxypyruvate isomerase
MLRLAANLSTLFVELPLEARFVAAASAGFRAVEMQFPYELAPGRLQQLLRAAGLHFVLFNAPPGDTARGERGLAGLPGREEEFRVSLLRAFEYAAATGCKLLHVMAGMRVGGATLDQQLATFQANLRWGAERAADADVTLLLEPINTRVDVPGYLLGDTATAVELLERIDSSRLALQFDFYHQHIMGGDVLQRFDALLPRIGHVQLADHPGRHEPGTGEIGFSALLAHIAASDYLGWVGCEYRPATSTAASLRWARPYLQEQ